MDECELISLVTAAACGISKCCSENEITIMAAVFTQLGDTLATILTCRELKEQNQEQNNQQNKEQNNEQNPGIIEELPII